ncbi:MAG: hypothetical protein AAGG81_04900 [Chlamydiota bacterium]
MKRWSNVVTANGHIVEENKGYNEAVVGHRRRSHFSWKLLKA